MSMPTPKHNITPLGVAVCALIIGVLVSLAVPRFIEASRPITPSSPPKALAGFGGEVGDTAQVGVAVSCKVCENNSPLR